MLNKKMSTNQNQAESNQKVTLSSSTIQALNDLNKDEKGQTKSPATYDQLIQDLCSKANSGSSSTSTRSAATTDDDETKRRNKKE